MPRQRSAKTPFSSVTLVYAGKAGTGFSGDTARALRTKLDRLTVRKSPLTVEAKKPKATWVKPQVLVDVEYRAITADGRMRHGSFGTREDLMGAKGKRSAQCG
jgi:bifunctional non-homologous end joining protein LigD